MGKFTGVLLASDFDNTLLYTEEALRAGAPVPPLPERNREALAYFMAQGGRFAVSTGRALAAFMKYAELVPMNAPGVVCNGAALYDFETGEYLETALLDKTALERGQAILDHFPEAAVEAYHIGNVIPLPLGKLLFEAEHKTLEKIMSFLRERNWAGDYELIFSGQTLLEMTIKGANKGGMVRRLAGRLGIAMDHVYCVGDEANDISMLTAAREGFAPANCVPAVRECGATVVCDAREGVLADVVQILDARYS